MDDRQVVLAACAQGCACRSRSRPQRWHQSAYGPTQRQSPRLSTGRQWPHTHDLALRDQRRIDSIPIAHHRQRGRFSPTGSLAYRTRRHAASWATACAPRPPGKRLSALCIVLNYAYLALRSVRLTRKSEPEIENAALHSLRSPEASARSRARANDRPADHGRLARHLGNASGCVKAKDDRRPVACCGVHFDRPRLCVALGSGRRGAQTSNYA